MAQRLRSVPGDAPERAAPEPRTARDPSRPAWIPIALAAALAITLALLVWSRLQLGGRIEALESEVATLRASVAQRDAVIAAQTARLGDVRARVAELQAVLDEPLPSATP